MKTRIITATVALALLVPLLIFSDTYLFVAAIAILAAVGAFEMLRCTGGLHKNLFLTVPGVALAGFAPFAVRLWGGETTFFYSVPVLLLAILYTFAVMVFGYGKQDVNGLPDAFLGCLYIVVGFASLIYLRDMENGQYLYLLAFFGAWVTDTFAYFVGMFLGKRKLIPAVSPKKTVAGSVGGMTACVIFFIVYGLFVLPQGMISPVWCGVMGLMVSVVSQIGDLAMSVIKRKFGIKDYGRLFPGHGGVMDRFDSTLAVSMVLSVMMTVLTVLA